MKKALVFIMLTSFFLMGCETPGPLGSIPKKPKVKTQKERDCLKNCDEQNALCLSSCETLRWDRKTPCRTKCYEELEKCYQLCLEE